MIKLFGIDDDDFTSNGDIVLQPLKAKIHKEDNGSFYLDLETGLEYCDELAENRIVVANTPSGDQAFRLNKIVKTKTKVTARANHLFDDTKNYVIADSYIYQQDCNYALDHLNSATDNTSPFTTLSNVSMVNSFRCVRKSLYEAVNTVLERWGGHLVRDNYTIKIMDSIGQDNGVTVRYGKNLKDINATYDWESVCTKLMPVGYEGLLLNEEYLYSTVQYDIPYTKVVSFDQSHINQDDYTSTEEYQQALIDDLRSQGQAYVNNHCYPQVNYTLKANLEKISDVGDTIEVIDERLGINLLTNLIAYDYDCILGKYTELEFGNFQQKLSSLISTITDQTQQQIDEYNAVIKVTLSEELQQATQRIWDAFGSSYVIYEGDKILVVDTLPKESATNVLMINAGGIGFSNSGINGTFNSAWTIDNVLNMEQINVINLTANLIKGGTLKLGSNLNEYGQLEIYDETNNLIGEMNKNGLKMFGLDGSYVLMNNEVGFAGYDRNDNQIYWVNKDEFHMKKSVVEEEITLCNKLRFIPITLYDTDETTILNDGIGLVSVAN